jgi:predicted phosphodiesterase
MTSPVDPGSSSRREWLRGALATTAALPLAGGDGHAADAAAAVRGGFSQEGHRIRLYSSAIANPVKLLFAADTHLSRDDARGEHFREYSGRMAKGYRQTRHFLTDATTDPETCFVETLGIAKNESADAVILAGDLLSFPSEAAIDWTLARLGEAGLPWHYTAGNHDWHYEGLPGSSAELRQTWIEKRLEPLYGGRDPMMSAFSTGGVKVLLLDNSTYEITAEQLDFFRRETAGDQPVILCVHIPLYAPGRPVGYGCGHPEWGAATDKNHAIERRPVWRERHSETTMAFHREVFATTNLLGIFAGHIHQLSTDVLNGLPQVVAGANATGAHLIIEVLPVAVG